MSTLLRLTLIFPPVLEPAITAVLISEPRCPGFTLFDAEGHTGDFESASVTERVLGHVKRRVLWMVLDAQHGNAVLDLLRERIHSRQVRWWLEPVLNEGHLA